MSLDVFQLGEFVREYMKNLVWTRIKKGSMNLYLQILSRQIQVQFWFELKSKIEESRMTEKINISIRQEK